MKDINGKLIKTDAMWHVGSPLPCDPKEVVDIQADGDELVKIRGLFPALTPTTDVAVFYGDIARTIFANLER
jgi:hypothetical protein